MAALPPVPSTIRVQWKHTFTPDVDVLCRMYFQYSGTSPTDAELATMASSIVTAWGTDMKGVTNTSTTLTEVIIEDLNTSTGAIGTATASTAGTRGTWSGGITTCMLVNFTVARRYRGGKPRVYLPPMQSSDLTNAANWSGGATTAATSGIQSFIAAIIAAVWSGGGSLTQVNVSYYSGFTVFTGPTGRARNIPKLRTGGPQVDAVTSVTANGRVGSQRRRAGKR